jgi:4-amino-4-deoxy-L-arabinose transferase-like glycosyltransferase
MYPLFLAAIFLASGFRPVALFVAQAVLVVITCILAYLIAGRLWPGLRGGRPLAALSVLLFVPLALTSSLVMADALMVCLVVASYYLVVRLDENGRTSDAVLGGLLMSLAVLTKPIALSYSVFVTVPLLWRLFRRRNILPLVCLLASFLLPLAAWALRNKLVCGSLTPFSTESGNNLWAGTYDPLSPFAIVFLDAPDDRLQQIVGGDYYINERAYDKLLRAAWQRIRHDPGGYVVRGVSRVVRVGLLDFPGGRSVLGRRPVVYRFSQLSMAVLWALFAIGLVNANHIRYILLSGPATIVSACLVMWCPARAFLPCDVLLLTGATAGVIVLYGRLRIAKGTYARTPQADQRLP